MNVAEGVPARLAEVDRQRKPLGLASSAAGHRIECLDLPQDRVGGGRARLQGLLGAVVIGIEPHAVDRLRPVGVVEDVRRCAELDVRIHKRAPADARRGDDGEVLHQAQVEHPARIENVVPEGEWRLLRAIRKVAWTEATAALEHANSPAPLGQAASGHSSAEAGAHHDRVVDALHGTHLTSQRRIGQGRISEVAELSFSR